MSYDALSRDDGQNNPPRRQNNSNVSDGESSHLLSPDRYSDAEQGQQSHQGQQGQQSQQLQQGQQLQHGQGQRSTPNQYSRDAPRSANRGSRQQSDSYAGGVELPLLFTPAPISVSAARGSNSNNNSNQRLDSSTKYIIPLILSYIIAVIIGSVGYITLRQSLLVSNRNMSHLQNELQDLETSITIQNTENGVILGDLQNQLVEQQLTLKYLSNLSNAHVLTELQNTRLDLFEQMSNTQTHMLSDLQAVQLNVTRNMAVSRSLVEELLVKSSDTLQVREIRVFSQTRFRTTASLSCAQNHHS